MLNIFQKMDNATYLEKLQRFEDQIPGLERMDFNLQFAEERKNTVIAFILSLFFGFLGADRFYLGQPGLGFIKLITFGGLGIWMMIDWFFIMSETRKRNLQIAEELRITDDFGVLS